MTNRIADLIGVPHQLAHAITVTILLLMGYLAGRML